MSADLYWLTLTALVTALMWVPYILNRIAVRGLIGATGNPSPDAAPHAPWAERAMLAHKNAVENLVIFGAVVLAANAAGASGELTATAAMIVFFARIAHYAIYVAGLPFLRTLAFAAGAFAQIAIGLAVIGWL
ncbi:MAG: MAPEG family protein [Pseudomonadota bacterium]